MNRMLRILAGVALALLAAGPSSAGDRAKKDYLVTATKPDRLFVIDAAERRIVAEHRVPDTGGIMGVIVPSPDGRIAYVMVNRNESIVGVDLQTGRSVFRADLSTPGERVKTMFAFDVTPDGRELVVYEFPVELARAEYRVKDPRFSVYRTDAGLGAKPVRQFAAPRRVHMLLMRRDGRSFYAVGFNLDEYDVKTGRLLGSRGIRDWKRPEASVPDLLAFWPVSEPTGVFSSPVYTTVTPAGGGEPVAKTSLMTLDLGSGELAYHDFEDTAALIFSTVTSPVAREAYGVYTQLTRIDTANHTLAGRVNLDHTYYAVNIATDGSELYLGGAMCDIAVYDPKTLGKKARIELPGCGDQSLASLRVVRR